MDKQETECWIKLSLSPKIRAKAKTLLEAFKCPFHLLMADAEEISKRGFNPKIAQEIAKELKEIREARVDESISFIRENRIRILTFLDKDYPPLLKMIPTPPLLLYVWGEILPQDTLALAVVGSRMASFYGLKTAQRLSRELAYRGFTIVSGLARGIDSAAHTGALEAGGRTIAVLGCGLDIVYPPENRRLKEKISAQGAVVSEFPVGTPVHRFNFPVRNRIVSGLSLGTVVVEAGKRSGALITAKYALEQSREVFAVPGHIDSPTSQGTHQILKEGAKLVEGVEDILEEIKPMVEDRVKVLKSKSFPQATPSLTSSEKEVYTLLSSEPKYVEEISQQSDLSPSQLLSVLSMLELKRLIRRLPGQRFVLI